ncbi:MAG: 2-amino-4-hydroxy-6-hydroxymethyldihydropteridine diphosphokinase [Isosphaeraceae bacterium]
MSVAAQIALGSNIGDREAHLRLAVAALASTPGIEVESVSRYCETAPVGGPTGQSPYLNAASTIRTSLAPELLLTRLHAIEAEAGRVRTARWGERTLDLDLLLYDDLILSTPTIEIPHPRMHFRRFVLAPLTEIAPLVIHPRYRRTAAQLLAHIDRRPSLLALPGWWERRDLAPILDRVAGCLAGRLVHAREAKHERPSAIDPASQESLLARPPGTLLAPGQFGSPEPGDTWLIADFLPLPLRTGESSGSSLATAEDGPIPLTLPTLVAQFSDHEPESITEDLGIPILRLRGSSPEEWVEELISACLATR